MTLRIITGTITEAKDPFFKLKEMREKGLFYKWHWNGKEIGWTYEPSHVVSSDTKKFSIIQTTGSGKTILLALYLYRAYLSQIATGANFSLRWTDNNKGKEKSLWQPVIQSIDDLEQAKHMHLGIDDIRGTITGWNTKEARLVSALSLLSRKMGNWIDMSTQRLENFIPPDMRFIVDEYIVPYIRVVDDTRRAPDGRGTPLELIAMRFSPGYELLDYELYDLNSREGQCLLDSYDTLQVAVGLKNGEDKPRTNQPGYGLEIKVFEHLKDIAPKLKWQHLNGKHVFDILSDTHAFDVCDVDPDGNPNISHKTFARHIATAKRTNKIPYIVFPYGNNYGCIRIKYDLPTKIDLSILNTDKRVRMLETVVSK